MPVVKYEERRAGVCAYLYISIVTTETSYISTDDCFAALCLVPAAQVRTFTKRTLVLYQKSTGVVKLDLMDRNGPKYQSPNNHVNLPPHPFSPTGLRKFVKETGTFVPYVERTSMHRRITYFRSTCSKTVRDGKRGYNE